MKIISINKYYWHKGGSETVFISEKEMLEENGHQVIPFSMQSSENLDSPFSKYFVEEVDYSVPGLKNKILTASKIIYSFDATNKMNLLLQNETPDVAHFHIFQHQISPSIFGPLKKKGIPLILTLHDLKPICPNYKMYVNGAVCEACKGGKFYNAFKNRCTKGSALGSLINTAEMYFHKLMGYYQNVDKYIAVSQFYKNKMIEFGFPEERISYLPNYIDADDFNPSMGDKNYILYFGRLSEEKGISTFLDSAMSNKNITHYIVGTGPLEQQLKEKAELYNIANVSFLGFKTGNELKTLLAEATCVVVPSEWYENCPMTILEAHASGRPVIGADIGGIPELIDTGKDGLIFEPGNAVELTQKIKWIWEHREEAKKMGLSGREKVESKFNKETHYEGLMSIYHSVLGQ